MHRGRRAGLVVAGLVIGATLITTAPVAAHGTGHVRVLMDGLSSPKGLSLGPAGSVLVAQGAFGAPGPVIQFKLGKNGGPTPISDPFNLMEVARTRDGAMWGIGGDGVLYRAASVGAPIVAVLDIHAYQAGDPDPYDQDGIPGESNPYGLTALKTNQVLVADAANNDVIRVSPNGDAVTVARWKLESIKTDKVGDPTLPKKLPAEAVPTSIAIGPDGYAYVGQLVGFPGRPGSAHIWRVNPWADGATCSVWRRTRDCKVWKSGFTSIVDLAFGPHGTLYVYEIAKDGWLAFEEGFTTGVFPPAVLLEVKGKHRHELAKGQLSQPGDVVVTKDGKVLVTDGMFGNGRLVRVR